jgi:hypothetical protein
MTQDYTNISTEKLTPEQQKKIEAAKMMKKAFLGTAFLLFGFSGMVGIGVVEFKNFPKEYVAAALIALGFIEIVVGFKLEKHLTKVALNGK